MTHTPELIDAMFAAFNEPGKSEGGMSRLADLLDISRKTVHSWKASGVPQWRRKPIIEAAWQAQAELPIDVMLYLDPTYSASRDYVAVSSVVGDISVGDRIFGRTIPEDFRGSRIAVVYPEAPGHQDTDTSKAAADRAAPTAAKMRDMTLAAIAGAGERGMTADEVASVLNLTPFSIRPRVTELKRLAKIKDSGERRTNASGSRAAVMVVA